MEGLSVELNNRYSYCNNSPLNKTDSSGQAPRLSTILTVMATIAFLIAAVALTASTGGLGGGALALASGGIIGEGAAAAATANATNAALVGIGATCAASIANMSESSGNHSFNKRGTSKKKSGSVPEYLEQLDKLSQNKINHIINGSKKSYHAWEKLVPDKNWNDIKHIIAYVMSEGSNVIYKTTLSKKLMVNGYIVQVVYKVVDEIEKISDAWICN